MILQCLSVILFTGGGGGAVQRGGGAVKGGVLSITGSDIITATHPLLDSTAPSPVNKWAVRILLECFLVQLDSTFASDVILTM